MDGALVLSGGALAAATRAAVGGKAANLAAMAAASFPVPPFFVVTSAALGEHLAANRIRWPDLGDARRVAAARKRIRTCPVPDAVAREVTAAYRRLAPGGTGPAAVAVRSSAAAEDGADASFAGQFSSILNVVGDEAVLDFLRECWASALSERSLAYRAALPAASAPGFAVIVQVQVEARCAGVLFTVHPLDPEAGTAYIEANFGTGESVVGGLVTPDSFTLDRAGAGVIESVVARKRRMTSTAAGSGMLVDVDPACRDRPVLTDDEAMAILALGLRTEALFGGPQDVEWAFDDRSLWVLQARPITTLPTRPGGAP